jgi:hypothetical protein
MRDLPGQPNLSQLLEAAIDAAGEQIRVAVPGVLQSVADDLSTATVQPAVRRHDSGADPAIPGVPLLFPGFGTGRLTWPVEPGDPCLLVFGDRSLDEWHSAGGGREVEPADPRTHDLTDAVALPLGLGGAASGRAEDISLRLTPSGADGTVELRLQSDGNLALGNSSRSGSFTKWDDNSGSYSGESELVSLVVALCDVLLRKLSDTDTPLTLVTGSNGYLDVDAYDELAEIRAKLNAIKGGL